MQVLAGPPDFGDGPIWASTSDVLMLEELELFDCNSEDMHGAQSPEFEEIQVGELFFL